MFHSRLFRRMFLLAMPVLTVFSLGLYIFAVPLIKSTAFEIEQNAGRTILNNVFALANSIHLNLERQREIAIEAHKRQLKDVISLAAAYGRQSIKDALQNGATRKEAKSRFFEGLRSFQYGNNDYVWAANYNGSLVSHPDPNYHSATPEDADAKLTPDVVRKMIEIAKQDAEGYHEYNWQRLGSHEQNSRKLSYFRAFPEWEIVIGTGVYIDDIAVELKARRKEAIEELRKGLRNIQIAKTGYLYIFDSQFNMIIHPNANIEQSNFQKLHDPLTGNQIGQELVDVADNPSGLIYKWDKPSDPGNYAYDKVAWVRHFKAFDWYIASSVYVEELKRSSQVLGNRILMISIIGLILSVILMSVFIRRLTQPIHALAESAKQVQAGNLNVQNDVKRDDEIGLLSHAFNTMVLKVRDNIDSLDAKVRRRTLELEETNRHLSAANAAQEQARKELVLSEQRQRLILDAIPAYVGYLDSERRLLFANRAFVELLSESHNMEIGMPLDAILPPLFLELLSPHIDLAYSGQTLSIETQSMRDPDDGCIRKNTFIPEFTEAGKISNMFFLSFDVTEEKQVEHKLMEAQRISATGQLSGGLAHDFNNLLSVIIGNLSTACDKFGDQPEITNYISPALRAGRRGADITNRLLAFSRKQPLAPRVIELKPLMAETIHLLKGSIPSHIKIRLDPKSEDCNAYVDANQLENALVNLAFNAKDAMPDGGNITFRIETWQDENPSGFDEKPGNQPFAAITVEDSGCGFTSHAREHALEPFFTTKHAQGGTGLGLSMVYGFVKQSDGFLKIAEDNREGASITLLLPSRPAHEINGRVNNLHKTVGNEQAWPGKLALLVDDDIDVRATVRLLLVDLGFSVLEAANGKEALQLLENVEDIYILISDIVMPGQINGYELAQKCHASKPKLHILLMTGYTPKMEQYENNHLAFTILKKPFDIRDLEKSLILSTGVTKEDEEKEYGRS